MSALAFTREQVGLLLGGFDRASRGPRELACPKLVITVEELPGDALEEELERER